MPVWRCAICGRAFNTWYQLVGHVTSAHLEEVTNEAVTSIRGGGGEEERPPTPTPVESSPSPKQEAWIEPVLIKFPHEKRYRLMDNPGEAFEFVMEVMANVWKISKEEAMAKFLRDFYGEKAEEMARNPDYMRFLEDLAKEGIIKVKKREPKKKEETGKKEEGGAKESS